MLPSKRRFISYALMLVLLVPMLIACGGTPATTAPATTGAPTTGAPTTGAPTAGAGTTTTPMTGTTTTTPMTGTTGTTAPTTGAAGTTTPGTDTTTTPTTGTTTTTTPGGGTGTTGKTDPNKTIVIGMTQAPDTLFGIESQSSATTQVLQAVQPGCVNTLDYEYQPVCFKELPSFENGGAVTRTVKVDNTFEGNVVINEELITDTSTLTQAVDLTQVEVTWTLIDGMKWEDGTPVTAKDFAFAFKLYQEPEIQNASRFLLERSASLEAKDDKTIVWTGAPGYSDATYFLNYIGLEPEHVLGKMEPGQIGGSDYASKPLAYGPYKIVEHVPEGSTTLVANENYWKAGQGFPRVGNVVFKYLTTEDQVIQQLEGGEIDVVGSIGLTLANAPKLDEMEKAGTIKA